MVGACVCLCLLTCSYLHLLSSADLTKVCDLEEDRSYIVKRCADVRAHYDHLVKKARDALALCSICEWLRQLQYYVQQHRYVQSGSFVVSPGVLRVASHHSHVLYVDVCV